MILSYGRTKALLGITAIMASPFVPMLFMGEEYGETAPFLFFEDFGDPQIVEATRLGRKREYALHGEIEPADPHAVATFEASKLRWDRLGAPECRDVLDWYKRLIAMKRSGELGPRDRSAVKVTGEERTQLIQIQTAKTLTLMNFSAEPVEIAPGDAWRLEMCSLALGAAGQLPAFGAAIFRRVADERSVAANLNRPSS
jgi:maltooligosyltrehalose trehalohydrolase